MHLKTLCNGYDEKDIYNCDETALFYRALPNRSLVFKIEDSRGTKLIKDRLSILLCVNGDGEVLPPLVIGRCKHPRCFKKMDNSQLPVQWTYNKRAWMTGDLFRSWLISLNKKFQSENRNVLLFLDNAPSHSHTQYSNITLKFFPPLCTAALQPLDQGIIRCFKSKYRTNFIRKLLSSLDTNEKADVLAKRVNILHALYWIRSSASALTKSTVRNCFHKAGFLFDEWKTAS